MSSTLETEKDRARLAELAEIGVDPSVFGRTPALADEPVPDDLYEQISQSVADEQGVAAAARSMPTWQRVGAVIGVLSVLTVATVLLTPRADLSLMPATRLWLGIALFGLVSVVTTVLALRPLHRPILSRRMAFIVLGLAVVAVPVGFALLPPAHLDHPASLAGTGSDFVPRALACFVFGLVMALPVLAATWLLDRQAHGAQ